MSGNVGCKGQRVSDARSRRQELSAHHEHCRRDRMEGLQGLFPSTLLVVCAARCIATGARTSVPGRYSCPDVYPRAFAPGQITRNPCCGCDSECPALRASGDLSYRTRTTFGRFGAGTERASRSTAGQGIVLDILILTSECRRTDPCRLESSSGAFNTTLHGSYALRWRCHVPLVGTVCIRCAGAGGLQQLETWHPSIFRRERLLERRPARSNGRTAIQLSPYKRRVGSGAHAR